MDKKTTYYVVGAVILIVVIGIVIAMQSGKKTEPPVSVVDQPKEVKTETQIAREVGRELQLAEGEIPLRITMDDNGQSAKLTPGKNLVLMLGADYTWDIKSSDETVLAEREVELTDERSQAVYQIVHSGKAVLNATGVCKSGAACAAQTQSFVFNVEGIIADDIPAGDLIK